MLQVELGADITRLQAGFAQAQNSVNGFVSNTSSTLEQFGKTFSDVGQKLSIAFSVPLGLLAKQAIQSGASLESLKLGLKSIEEQQYGVGKSAEYASGRFAEYVELAKRPGVGLAESISMSIGLRSVGFSAGEAKREILAFGNALALVGKGKNELNGVALQLQQLSGKQSGFGADLRVIKEYAPQVGMALQKAFGTIDTEAIAKTGVNGKQVIERITVELEKLPTASAGAKNALENIGDATFISFGRIGEALFKALNFSEISDRIQNVLGGIASAFESLSPTTQKFIGIFGGLLIIVPPILAGIGLMIPAFTAIGTAVSALSLPVIAIGAGIAGLTYIVVTNWNEIKSYLTDTGIWDSLKQIVTGTFGVIKGTFELSVRVIKSIWNDALSIIHKDTFGIFAVISGVISSALQMISGIVNAFSNALQGNWKGLGNSLVTILKGSFNFMVTMTEGFVLAITGVFRKLFEMIGADTITKQFVKSSESLKKTFEGFKYNTGDSTSTGGTTSLFGSIPDLLAGNNTKPPKQLTDEEKAELKAREKARQEFLKNTQKLLSDALNMENSLINEKYKRELAIEQQTYEDKKANINKEVADKQAKHRALEALERTHQKKMAEIVTSASFGSATVADGGMQGGKGLKNLTSGLNIGNPLDGLTKKLDNSIPQVLGRFKTFQSELAVTVGRIAQVVDAGAKEMTIGFGSWLGSMAIGSAGIQDLGNMLLQGFGGILTSIGEQLIASSTLFKSAAAAIALALTPAGAGLALAAGIGLVALGTAISGSASGGSSGGGVSASSGYSSNYSSGNSGYNSGYNQSNNGRSMTVNVKLSGDLKASGNDLRYTLEKNIRQTVRTTGGN